MAKKSKGANTKQMFSSEIPEMSEGYYSGDKPNPNLRTFIEACLRERPHDAETDDYNIPAFDKPIETTKATAIYNMHTYWSKKPHDAIRQYIRHYTQPRDLVLDPFCGSGGLRPDRPTLAEWIRYCKRSGLYEQGKLLFEKGGLNFDSLSEEIQAGVEEDYQVCSRMLAWGGSTKERLRSEKD